MAHRQGKRSVAGEGQGKRNVASGLPSGSFPTGSSPPGITGAFPGGSSPSSGFRPGMTSGAFPGGTGPSSGFPTATFPLSGFPAGVTFTSRDQEAAQHGSFMSLFNNPFIPHSAFSSPEATRSNKFIDLEKDDSSDRVGSHLLDNNDTRTAERLLWKETEDVRLMSAWLKHSIDSKDGNAKKGEKYWGDVAKEYDLSTPQNRKRNVKQVKERWHKINKWTNWFNDTWIKVKGLYTSGYSDEMWIEKAHKMYEEDHAGAKFNLIDVWNMCRYQAKWISYNTSNKTVRKRKEGEEEGDKENGEANSNEEEVDLPRPMGQKAAKRAALLGSQGKNKDNAIDVEALDRFEKIQSNSHANRVKLLEIQKQLSGEKEKASKLAVVAAREHKNAKLVEKDIKMLDTYNSLLNKDTSHMAAEERAEHVLALKCLRKSLFPDMS